MTVDDLAPETPQQAAERIVNAALHRIICSDAPADVRLAYGKINYAREQARARDLPARLKAELDRQTDHFARMRDARR